MQRCKSSTERILGAVPSGYIWKLDTLLSYTYTYVLHKITEVVSPLNGLPQGLALSEDLINLPTLVRQLSFEGCQLFLPLFALLPSNHFLGRMLGQISEVQQLT